MSGFRVVVVNDEPVQLTQITAVLSSAGHEVQGFECAADALDALSGGTGVDLFALDLHMPGIDGWKLCRLLRSPEFAAFNATPILIISATYAGEDVVALTRELGADAFLEAPFDAPDLLAVASRLLEGGAVDRVPTALIIEDDPSVRRVLARAFADEGYAVTEEDSVARGREAWLSARPNVVLVDHHLPDGTSESLLMELAGLHDRTTVLVMTGDSDPFLPVRLFSRGADGYLRKPFEPSQAVESARSVGRQRALLRIGSVLQSRHREREALERSLNYTRRLESLGLLAGGIAHEFNNLLAGIMGHADLALLDIDDDSPARSSLAQITALSRKAAEHTRQILVYAGEARLDMRPTDLAVVVSTAVGRLERTDARRVVVTQADDEMPLLRGDQERLVDSVLGLLDNAVEATEGKGGGVRVELGTREIRPGATVEVEGGGTAPPGRYAFVQVTDEGVGMDPTTRTRMFDPFFSTKFMGRGLGLAAVLGIMRTHGGHIHVRTASGRGTSVTLLFPVRAEA